MRAVERLTGVSINTVAALQERVGRACSIFHDRVVRGVEARRIECDEIWSFTYAKEAHLHRATAAPPGAGSTWTWTAIDPDTKLMVAWAVGSRGVETAIPFMVDLRSRLVGRVQLTTDGHHAYLDAVDAAFGADVDFSQIIKVTDSERNPVSRVTVVVGAPDPARISTSLVERQNLTMRMCMRRYTRRTNAHSKRVEAHRSAAAIYFVWYNFCRVHSSLGTTPAVAAGLASRAWSLEWLAEGLPRVYWNDGSQRPLELEAA